MISAIMARCLRHIETNEPHGVDRWPLGSVGITRTMAAKCVAAGYAYQHEFEGSGRVATHITTAGIAILREHRQATLKRPLPTVDELSGIITEFDLGNGKMLCTGTSDALAQHILTHLRSLP